ncbi:DUF6629 family protein [Sulfurovum sp. NBC37-1]|uniref:DUF6629 family protein n=1 Tax=Sulfurovum sp. (strain NBC37-1) TaxID=387093 RepID=UPI00015875C7|nr:DUF6629 family protein [Sulfurovum sp. NBC37-1]BAF72161.1 conserved hypothetical protein [Sulfurovum sp. NBC37-1]
MFSIILNFTLSGALFVVAILTFKKVSIPKEVAFASLPFLFALHQFTQGFVWLGMYGLIGPRALGLAEGIFVFYAQGLLQFLIPLSLWLIEPAGTRRKLIGVLMVIGGILTAYTLYGLAEESTSVYVKNHILVYVNEWTDKIWVGILYVLTTCGALLLSRSIAIQLFGLLNFLFLVLVYVFIPYGLTSVWCLYAAAISVLLYFYFVERRIAFLQILKKKEVDFNSKLEKELNTLKHRYPKLREKWQRRFSVDR